MPAIYPSLPGLQSMPCARPLAAWVAEIPQSELWLVGHRALRDVPRFAAVWTWLRETFANS